MKTKKLETFLTPQDIDSLSGEINDFCKDINMDKKEIVRLKLSVEEVLLRWQNVFGAGKPVQLSMRAVFGKFRMSLSISGDSHNPLDSGSAYDDDVMVRRLMDNLTLSLKYNYQNGINRITCDRQIKADNSFFASLIIAVIAGIIFGFAGRLLPAAATISMMEILNLISQVILGLIKMAAMPVIFLCTVRGIVSTGGLAAFGSSGKRTILGYLFSMFCILVFSIFVSTVFFIGSNAGHGVYSHDPEYLGY